MCGPNISTHRRAWVVPKQGDDRPRCERVPPLRGRQQGGRRPRRGQPQVLGHVRLPRNGSYDRAVDPQLHGLHGRTVTGGTHRSARGARIGAAVPQTQVALAAGASRAALGTAGGPRGSAMAGGRIAATDARTGRRPRVVALYVGVATLPSPPAIFAVVLVGSNATARLWRAAATVPVAGSTGVVVAPRRVPATVTSYAGPPVARWRAGATISATRTIRRGEDAEADRETPGVHGPCLFLTLLGPAGPRGARGCPRRGNSDHAGRGTRRCKGL